jgi:DNA processing protein
MHTPPSHIRYYLGFNLVRGIGPARLAQLIAHCGTIAAAWHAPAAELAAAGLDARTIAALDEVRQTCDLDAELAALRQAEIDIITLEDPTYPRLLREVPAAPPMVYVRGTLTPADGWAIAVVGTRTPTSYGKEATRHIVGELAQRGITVVSGLAVGIDTVAHQAALEAGGRTIAVQGCGLDRIYPADNRKLAHQIVAQGALMSDYPRQTRPHKDNFPPRNRIISGLALGTLVVEADEQSGALITVNFAADQGRDAFAVPGSIFSHKSRGTHKLIRNGAGLVTCADDLLEALHLELAQVQQEVATALPLDEPNETALMAHLSKDPQHIDVLVRASGLDTAAVLAALAMLEIKGYVRQAGHQEYVRTV